MTKQNIKILILLILTVLLTNVWKLFPNSEGNIDLFLFSDYSQTLHWYIFDTTEMLKMTILYYIINQIVNTRLLKQTTLILFTYSVLRLIDYWITFNNNEVFLTTTIIVLTILIFTNERQYKNKGRSVGR